MAQIHWRNQVSDDFGAASDWTGGVVPGEHDDAILDASGPMAYTVTASSGRTVGSLQTNALATLAVTGGTFTALGGTGDGKNRGAISIGDGATFVAGGAFDNAKGTVLLNAAGLHSRLLVAPGGLTLTGGGRVRLSDSAFNRIAAASTSTALINVDNTISGAGRIGGGGLALFNRSEGVIEAVGAAALILDTTRGATAINDGLIEAAGPGGLVIRQTTVDGSGGGVIQAGDGARVRLRGAAILGGTLRALGSGVILSTGDTVLDGTASAVRIEGRVGTGHHSLTLKGTIDNAGTLTADNRLGPRTTGDLIIAAGTTTLIGGGQVRLQKDPRSGANRISAEPGATLVNLDDTITGRGDIGGFDGAGANLTFINQGTVEARSRRPLVLDTGPNTIANAGLIEAAGHGMMRIMSAVDNTGRIAGDGGTIHLYGTQTNRAGGVEAASQKSGELDFLNATVVNAGEITATVDGRVGLFGGLVNSGALEAVGGAIQVAASGGETVSNLAAGVIEASGANGLLTLDGQMSNAGLIAAKDGARVTLQGSFIARGIANSGVIEAAGGTLISYGAITNTGVIEVDGGLLEVDAKVTGNGSAVIGGGTLFFAVAFDEAVTFTGATGELVLGRSRAFTQTITGFSASGGTSLDLKDIAFTGAGQATFKGNSAGGTLTVTDGTHAAHIELIGAYTGTTFVAGADGRGGVTIVDTGGPAPPHAFIAAAAAFGPLRPGPIHAATETRTSIPFSMASPRAHLA